MNKFQQTLGAIALSTGILAGSTFAEDVKNTKATTQTGVATALATKDDTNNKGKIKQVSFQEMSPEEQKKLVEEAGNKTISFLKENAPEYAEDKKVLVATTAGALEYGDMEKFFKRLKNVVKLIQQKEDIMPLTAEHFIEKSPNFCESIKDLEIYKGLTDMVALIEESKEIKEKLKKSEERLEKAKQRGKDLKMLVDFFETLKVASVK